MSRRVFSILLLAWLAALASPAVAHIAHALLDGQPMPVTIIGTGTTNWTNQWRVTLEVTPGAHQLVASALHPSGLFTTNASARYTNNVANLSAADTYDGAGNLTQRLWKNPNGATNLLQTLSWDARGRLYKVVQRDTNSNGFDWQASYDGLNRRLQTKTIIVTNGISLTNQPKVISQYYDPEHRFLEVAVVESGKTTWKLYGPDQNGIYGGLNGTGGFEAIVPGPDLFCPTVSDGRGNLHAVYDGQHAGLIWFAARPTGYGAVPSYRPLPLGHGADIAASSAWRGCWSDITGIYCKGERYYDPVAGRFLSADPYGHDGSPDLYSAFNGDPINYFDPDGRVAKGAFEGGGDLVEGTGHLLYNLGGTVGYGLTSLVNYEAAEDMYGQQRRQFLGAVQGVGQTLYDVGGSIGLTLTGDDEAYGASADRLYGVANAASGGEGKSGAYRVGYTGVQVAAAVFGGELGELRLGGRTAQLGEVAGEIELSSTVGELRAAGLKDAHHVIQDAAVRDLPGYDTQLAPGVQVPGPSTAVGTPHYIATQVQAQAGGGTLAAEMRIGYKALRRAGYSEANARQIIAESDDYFRSIGTTPSTRTRIPGNRH